MSDLFDAAARRTIREDLDKTLEAVRAAGGKIVREPFAFPGGRRFQFTDPSGNELGVWSQAAAGQH